MAFVALVGGSVAAWLSYANSDRTVSLVSQTTPVLAVRSRSAGQSYELSQTGTTHTLTVTLGKESYSPQIFPRLEWTFRLSDETGHDWICKGLVLRCVKTSPDDVFLMVDEDFEGNTPYEVVHGKSYRIVKHWWVSNVSQKSVTQQLHLYLIANDSKKILAEHRMTIVVNVVVPERKPN